MWHPDGAGWRARIGVLTPHYDPVPESEFQAMAPPGVSVHTARVPLGVVGPDGRVTRQGGSGMARAFAEPPHVDAAAALLAAIPLHVVAYAFTSSSYILGADADAVMRARLEECTGGIPVVVSTLAACLALRAVRARRIALVHPPWFSGEVDQLGAEYFRTQSFEVVHHGAAPLRGDFGEVHPAQIYEWVRRVVPASAEAVFIGGNGLRAVGAIRALEEDLGRPVLSANQVLIWHALCIAGVRAPVSGYGRLFAHDTPQGA